MYSSCQKEPRSPLAVSQDLLEDLEHPWHLSDMASETCAYAGDHVEDGA